MQSYLINFGDWLKRIRYGGRFARANYLAEAEAKSKGIAAKARQKKRRKKKRPSLNGLASSKSSQQDQHIESRPKLGPRLSIKKHFTYYNNWLRHWKSCYWITQFRRQNSLRLML
jgi:hypothetical protein